MTFGVEPHFPFDIEEATFLAPNIAQLMDSNTLVAIRARQLEKRETDVQNMQQLIWKLRRTRAAEFEKKFHHVIKNYDLPPGRLVLVRNSAEDSGLKNKYKPRYLGPFIVVSKNDMGTYTLAEMDGTISKLKFSSKRIIPYYLRSKLKLPEPNELLENTNRPMTTNKNNEYEHVIKDDIIQNMD
jgi:hypothetical protein